MTITDLCFATLTEVATLVKDKEISPVELTEGMLDRIETVDSTLHSYITVLAESAIDSAQQAEREIMQGDYRGPLHGVPIAVKDLYFTAGVRTTCASKILADWIPDYDATVVKKLQTAGAVMLGKLNMTEFACIDYHPSYTAPLNPWNLNHWPGASSSGSAVAAAAGLCYGSLGSDTGGSIRFPAASCGVVGIKPTYGRVSRHGVFPLAESMDHVGPMARSVADAATLLGTIAGFDSQDCTSSREAVPDLLANLGAGVKSLRIGVDSSYCRDHADPQVSSAVSAAVDVMRDLGADIREVSVNHIDEAVAAWSVIFAAEAAAAHGETFPSRAADYGPGILVFLKMGVEVRGVEYAKAQVTRQKIKRVFEDLFLDIDLLLCPSTLSPPAPLPDNTAAEVADAKSVAVLLRTTAPTSLAGNPTISVPCGFTADGLPLSMQLIGRHFQEPLLCQAAYAYEQAVEWRRRRPPL